MRASDRFGNSAAFPRLGSRCIPSLRVLLPALLLAAGSSSPVLGAQPPQIQAPAAQSLKTVDAQLVQTRTQLQEAKALLEQCRKQAQQPSPKPKPPPIGSAEQGVTGHLGVGGKSDSVTPLEFPQLPGHGTPLEAWLSALDTQLLSVIKSIYPSSSDISQFLAAEASTCKQGGVYCEIVFRQQVILRALRSGG